LALNLRGIAWSPLRFVAWAAAAIVLGVALALTVTSKASTDDDTEAHPNPRTALIQQSQARMHGAARLARSLRLRDSLARTFRGKNTFIIAADPNVPDSVRATIDRRTRKEVGELAAHPLRVPVVLFITTHGDDVATLDVVRPETMRVDFATVPRDASGDPCIVILDKFEWLVSRRLRSSCAWFAKYGYPGRGVRDHLLLTGNLILRPPRHKEDFSFGSALIEQLMPQQYGYFARIADLHEVACTANRMTSCERELHEPAVTRLRFSTASEIDQRMWDLPLTRSLLASIAEEVGPGRFQSIWSSDLPLDQSYRSVTGRSLLDLLRRHQQAIFGTYIPADSLKFADFSFLIVTVAGILVALITHARRQVGA
jgi:hypothetical protein